MTGEESRQHTRKGLDARVWIGEEEQEGTFSLGMRNLSLGGMYLESAFLFEPGEILTIAFDLHDGMQPISLTASVIWASMGPEDPEHRSDLPGMGLEFMFISPQDQARIKAVTEN